MMKRVVVFETEEFVFTQDTTGQDVEHVSDESLLEVSRLWLFLNQIQGNVVIIDGDTVEAREITDVYIQKS